MSLQNFKDTMGNQLYGMTTEEAKAKSVCIQCKEEARQGVNIFTPSGEREWQISGLCEKCFDEITT